MENLGIYLGQNAAQNSSNEAIKEAKLIQTQQLMKIIDPKSNGKVVHATTLEARLNKFNLQINQVSKVDKIEWKDKALTKMAVALQDHLGNESTIDAYFNKFDSDYDGFLTPREFFEALRFMSQDFSLQDYQYQRVVQKLISKKSDSNQQPTINILSEIKPYFEKLIVNSFIFTVFYWFLLIFLGFLERSGAEVGLV